MPIYLYRCRRCGHDFELLRPMNQKDIEQKCPECGSKEIEKVAAPVYGGGYHSFG